MLSGLYVISSAGIPLYFHSDMYSDNADNDILFSGVINAIQKLLIELNVGEVQEFKTNNYKVVLYSEKNFAYAFLLNKKSKTTSKSLYQLYMRLNENILPLLEDFDEYKNNQQQLKTMLKIAISSVLVSWEKEQKESDASRKAKESLW